MGIVYKTEPRKYQRGTVEAVLEQLLKFFAINADPGLGKTKMIIDIASNLYLRGEIEWCIVFAPNGVHSQWVFEQLPIHSPIEYSAIEYSAAKWNSKAFQDSLIHWSRKGRGLKWLCVNIDAMSTQGGVHRVRGIWKELGGQVFCVCDESHTIKNPGANRSKTMHKVGNTAKYRATLTGTPVTNGPFDLWSQYEYLHKNYFGCSYFVFQHRYGILIRRQNNGKYFNVLVEKRDIDYVRTLLDKGKDATEIAAIVGVAESAVRWIKDNPHANSPYRNMDELRDKIQPVTFTLRKEDHLDLPPKIFSPIYAEMSSEQKEALSTLKKQYMAQYKDQALTVDNKLTLGMRIRQITGGFFPTDDGEPIAMKNNPKLSRLLEDLEETDGIAIIVWAVYRAEIVAIADAIKKKWGGWRVETYYGDTKNDERKIIRDDFQAGKINVMVANGASAGTGLNLQRSTLHYFYSNDFSFQKRLQEEDRSHRIGQDNTVTYKDIVIKGTLDETILDTFRDRKEILDYFRICPIDAML